MQKDENFKGGLWGWNALKNYDNLKVVTKINSFPNVYVNFNYAKTRRKTSNILSKFLWKFGEFNFYSSRIFKKICIFKIINHFFGILPKPLTFKIEKVYYLTCFSF